MVGLCVQEAEMLLTATKPLIRLGILLIELDLLS